MRVAAQARVFAAGRRNDKQPTKAGLSVYVLRDAEQASVFMSYAMPNSINTTISMIGMPINHKRIGIWLSFSIRFWHSTH